MTIERKCLNCGSIRLEPGAVQSTGRVYFRPENTKVLTLKTGDISTKGLMCLDCGFIGFFGDIEKAESLTKKTS